MASRVRTIDFLPEIFRTTTNEQFLNATLDQLVQPPQYNRIQGYIGSKFGYGVQSKDTYLSEPSKDRVDYQLEPAIIFNKKGTSIATDAITYPGLIDALTMQGAVTKDHSKLFTNEFYSWDSFVDLDKLINYSQYYWLPQGPDPVTVTTGTIFNRDNFTITSKFDAFGITADLVKFKVDNPTITLVRGGSYKFAVDQTSPFWIQTQSGIVGHELVNTNFSTREIYGVTNNGNSTGTITFDVPLASAQDDYNYPGTTTIDLITSIKPEEIHGRRLSELKNIDGVSTLNGKTLMFYGFTSTDTTFIGKLYDDSVGYDSVPNNDELEEGSYSTLNNNQYLITYVGDPTDPILTLSEAGIPPNDEKITAVYGDVYANRAIVRGSLGDIILVPLITATLSELYYQDGNTSGKFGKIKLIDSIGKQELNIDTDIIGKKTYTSPNDIKFTNGLKIKFSGNILPIQYYNDEYYIEGVGTSITLVPVSEQTIPEPFGQSLFTPYDISSYDTDPYGNTSEVPIIPDYIIINRNSINRNAWSRTNRWFHIDVLNYVLEHNSNSAAVTAALSNSNNRAKRPIIEFYSNLKLFNSGTVGKLPVDYINFSVTDAFNEVEGKETFAVDGSSGILYNGARVIFAGDTNPEVKNKIYVVAVEKVSTLGNPVITLSKAFDGDVTYNEQTVITKGETHRGYSFHFDGQDWIESQLKQSVNQYPKFDIFDNSGISFGNREYYPGSDFEGSALFKYATGTGANDLILGFPIKYSSIINIGDISFDVSINSDIFNYVYNNTSISQSVGTGYAYTYNTATEYVRQIGWQPAIGPSVQYQIFNLTFNGSDFICDIAAKDETTSNWPIITVYIDNQRVDATAYTYNIGENSTTVTLTTSPAIGTPVEILLYSDQVSKVGYYQIPTNFDHNPFNEQIISVNLGDLRGQYKSICNNTKSLVGAAFGPNNYRDLGNIIPYGTRIIQNSASIIAPSLFLKSSNNNFLNALTYNATEYIKFKTLLMDTVNKSDYLSTAHNADILDDALDQISSVKGETSPFFWSDMLPGKGTAFAKSYTFKSGLASSTFVLSKIYDFKNANYDSVLIYLTRKIDGITRTIQLMKDIDYTISTTSKYVKIETDLLINDIITIKEYTQTYGSYIPNTPTKLGLYPAFIPQIILDSSYITPTYFIQGHDGSYTKLYGAYNSGYLEDFRDRVLFEFESRIYNNLKVNAKIPLEYDDVIPGQFRTTNYTNAEITQLYSTQFLNWIGLNRIDYISQNYNQTNEFTWNFNRSINKLDQSVLKQGNWRGIYLWLYDTANPDTKPWEMLGLVNKPIWWDTRYGEAPYTSDNTLLWNDISQGYIWNNGDSNINSKRVRPELLTVLPVDTRGKLVSPFTSIVNSYDINTFKKDWAVGDSGPAEYSYLKSSTWPFDLMRIFALTTPAKFFTLGLNLDSYKYNTEFNQYLVNDRARTEFYNLTVYGKDNTTAAHSYLNWIVDYVNQYGIDGHQQIQNLIENVDVRLTYRLAGFSDKTLLKFFAEKGSPNSKNNSLLIPDESYSVLLCENQPYESITYSSVIVQKTENGYKVYGNGQEKAYFIANIPMRNGSYETVAVGNTTVFLSKTHSTQTITVPYGTEFKNTQDLADFIYGYGYYLEKQGVSFNDIENAIELNWKQMVAEVLYWISSGWEIGSTVNVNPCANLITITNELGIIQPLTLYQDNFILNQNLVPIKLVDLAITRIDTTFSAKALNAGDTISFLKAKINSIEHVIVFDNLTVFNDIMFNLITGLRQQRLYVKGSKTASWNGSMTAAGFIINQDNIEEWKSNVKYNKGTIVKYKNEYWVANAITIVPNIKFNPNEWHKTVYEDIQIGLLPNPSTRAYESTLYYDTNISNLKTDADLLSFSLIGYRPRNYLADANLSDSTQVNLYKNMIAGKGTRQVLDALIGANLQQTKIDYIFHENWAIKKSEFGGVLNKNFIEITLDESKLLGNPAVIELTNGGTVTASQQQIPIYNIKNYSYSINDTNILPTIPATTFSELPTAGYVNIDDIRQTGYYLNNLDNTIIGDLYKNDYIWIADKVGEWKVYTPVALGVSLIQLLNNLNGTVTLTFSGKHTLVQDSPFGIINFDTRVNGYYTVLAVADLNTIIVSLSLPASTTKIVGSGLSFGLINQRVSIAKDILDLPLLNNEYISNKVWVDSDQNGEWCVYEKSNNYISAEFPNPNSTEFGSAVANTNTLGYFVTDTAVGKMYNYFKTAVGSTYSPIETITKTLGFGKVIVKNEDILIVSHPDPFADSVIYVYRMVRNNRIHALVEEQILLLGGFNAGDAMALSGDGNYLYVSLVDLNAVVAYQKDTDYYRDSVGLVLSEAVIAGSTTFVCYGDVAAGAVAGKLISFSNTGFDDVYTIVTASYSVGTDSTTFYVYETIPYTISSSTVVYRASINYSILGAVTSEGLATGTDSFSYSLATNYDGTKLFVGSPKRDHDPSLQDTGYVFAFDRLVENWEIQADSPPLSFALFFMPWDPTAGGLLLPIVSVNGTVLPPGYYLFVSNLLIIGPQLFAGDIVTVSSGTFVLKQEIVGYDTLADITQGEKFGFSLDCNTAGSELIVGSPFNIAPINQKEGVVYRYTNEGKRFGRITGLLQCNLLDPAYILINGYGISIPEAGNAAYVANVINQNLITNVFAYATEDNRLVIRLRDMDLNSTNNKLTLVVFNGTILAELGIAEYIKTQVIYDPRDEGRTQFGHTVKFNESNSFVVSAPVANRYVGTFFDRIDDGDTHNDTVFDNNFTVWEDVLANAGSVYMYDYIPSYGESLLTAGNYIYAQSCNDTIADYGAQPYYGQSLDFNNNTVLIGTPKFKPDTEGGQVVLYENSKKVPDWSVFRQSEAVVDISKIQRVQLYNNITDVTISPLDYFDPLQGKLLGPIRENIDYISGSDPAGYNNPAVFKGNLVWSKNQVGKMWFDTTTTKFINYHQNDLSYNTKYWGNVFPGSTVTVYSWVESDVIPGLYTGLGTPYDFSKYSAGFTTDSSGNLVAKYYYWVRNSNILFSGQHKTLTDTVLEQYIANPQNSGLSYLAPILPNVYALYNARDYIYNTETNLHIGYSINDTEVANHIEFQLIRTEYPDDFLGGVPDKKNVIVPNGLYNKLLCSLAGVDELGAVLPNPDLPKLLQIGVGVRPNQSLFLNRFGALENYLTYANTVLKQYPVSETANLTFLSSYGENYDTRNYWENIYWWATGYTDQTKTAFEVNRYYDLQLVDGVEGMIVGVSLNSQDKREVYKYTNSSWSRIGLEDGTIKFLDTLWNYQTNKIGYGNNFFDTVLYGSYPSTETRFIIRALNEQIYTGPLFEYRNKSLILLFEYIQSENIESHNHLPWLNKTSLADISYNIRDLLPYQKYQSDNQNLINGYINEVKPYHVVLKEFYFNYTGIDTYAGTITDFDLPAEYDSNINKFVAPELYYGIPDRYEQRVLSDPIWNTDTYTNWFNNYGLKLESKPNVIVGYLRRYVTTTSQDIYVDNARGFPIEGIIKIENELISYTSVDRENNKLSGLSRGFNNTTITVHYPNIPVYSDLPGVILLDTGYGYIDPPIVTAYIDTTKYPAPRVPAVIQAVMSGDKVIRIDIIDSGEGYAVAPEIRFDSSLDVVFTENDINISAGLLVLPTTQLVDNTIVYITSTKLGVITEGYYYIKILNTAYRANVNTAVITLHTERRNSFSGEHRVIFKSNYVDSTNVYTLSVVPRAVAGTRNNSVREITSTIKMDRLSYSSIIEKWNSGEFWPSPFNSLGNDASTGTLLSYGIPYESPASTATTSSGLGAQFTIYNKIYLGNYEAVITTPGTGYAVGDTFDIAGDLLGGVSPTNDCTITVATIQGIGATGPISTFASPATGEAVVVNLSSLQGSVLPITNLENDSDTAIVTVNYVPSTLKPGQVKGLRAYFYREFSAYTYDDSAAGGAVIEIYRPRFTPTGLTNQYFIKILDYGSIYYDDYPRIVIAGDDLGGVTGTNDAVITIKYADAISGEILVCSVAGVAVGDYTIYYVQPISSTQLRVFEDLNLSIPALYSGFEYNGSNSAFAYIPEPFFIGGGQKYIAESIVSYNNRVWKCIESNSDTDFDYAKWQEIYSDDRTLNAIDRVTGFYTPTADMPSNDLRQLISGIAYPNNIYYGNSFAPDEELPLDFVLKDQPFYPRDTNIKAITFDGTYYVAVGDSLDNSVVLISSDGENWNSIKLSGINLGVTDIIWSGSYYVITTTNLASPILISTDRENWYATGSPYAFDFLGGWDSVSFDTVQITAPQDQLYAAIYANDTYFAVGKDILSSIDSVNWSRSYGFGSQLDNDIKSITYVDIPHFVGYVAVGSGYQVLADAFVGTAAPTIQYSARILTSITSNSWQTYNPPITTRGMNAVMSSDTYIVIAGESGEIWYSTNSHNWIQANIAGDPVTTTLRDGTYANSIFLVVGDSGTILKSTDGISWTQITSTSITVENLNGITYDGTYFYVVGENGTILRTSTGAAWDNLSFITTDIPFYDVKGSDFLYGYGPEELIPGVINDNLSLTVHTAPGAYWDKETYTQDFLYQATGFNMVSKVYTPVNLTVSFAGLVENPAQVAVFGIIDAIGAGPKLHYGPRLYENVTPTPEMPISYSVDWITKTITLSASLDTIVGATISSILVEVYEIGNGQQLIRSNSQSMPMIVNPITGYSEIPLGIKDRLLETPIVYHNGVKLEYLTDYTVISNVTVDELKIIFTQLYDDAVDYFSFTIFADSLDDYNTNHYVHSIPETQVIVGIVSTYTYSLSNYISLDEVDNAIVEINGYRLASGTDYTINHTTSELTIDSMLGIDGQYIGVTTFNDTQRQYLKTDYTEVFTNSRIYYVDNTVTPVRIITTDDLGITDTDYEAGVHLGESVRIDGMLGSTELNGLGTIDGYGLFFAYIDESYTGTEGFAYKLYIVDPADDELQVSLSGDSVSNYISDGYMCKTANLPTLTQTTITLNINGDPYVISPKTATRTWVTVNGNRVDPNHIRIYLTYTGEDITAVTLNVLAPITLGDHVMATTMVSGASPNESTFNIHVDKNSKGTAYSFNSVNRTWITQDLIISDTVIHLKDASKAIPLNSNMIQINGEKIRFRDVNYENNTVSTLTRGIEGTGIVDIHGKGSFVHSLSPNTKLIDEYYFKVWNSQEYSSRGDPQQLSNTVSAKFL